MRADAHLGMHMCTACTPHAHVRDQYMRRTSWQAHEYMPQYVARAMSYVELQSITRSDLWRVLGAFPDSHRKVQTPCPDHKLQRMLEIMLPCLLPYAHDEWHNRFAARSSSSDCDDICFCYWRSIVPRKRQLSSPAVCHGGRLSYTTMASLVVPDQARSAAFSAASIAATSMMPFGMPWTPNYREPHLCPLNKTSAQALLEAASMGGLLGDTDCLHARLWSRPQPPWA